MCESICQELVNSYVEFDGARNSYNSDKYNLLQLLVYSKHGLLTSDFQALSKLNYITPEWSKYLPIMSQKNDDGPQPDLNHTEASSKLKPDKKVVTAPASLKV